MKLIIVCLFVCCIFSVTAYSLNLEQAKIAAQEDAKKNLSERAQGFWIAKESRAGLNNISIEIIKKSQGYLLKLCKTTVENIDSANGFVIAKASIAQYDIMVSLEDSMKPGRLTLKQIQDIKYLFPKETVEYGYAAFTPSGERVVNNIKMAKLDAAAKLGARLFGEVISNSETVDKFILEHEEHQATLENLKLIGCGFSKPIVNWSDKKVYIDAEIKIPLYILSLSQTLKELGVSLTLEECQTLQALFNSYEKERGEAVLQ